MLKAFGDEKSFFEGEPRKKKDCSDCFWVKLIQTSFIAIGEHCCILFPPAVGFGFVPPAIRNLASSIATFYFFEMVKVL